MEHIAGSDKVTLNFLPNGALSKPLNPESGNYVFIDFEDNDMDETKSISLTRHDQLFSKLYKELLSSYNQQIVVIFTGKRAQHRKRIARQIEDQTTTTEATNDTIDATNTTEVLKQPGIFWKRDNVLLYYTAFNLVTNETIPIVFDNVTVYLASKSEFTEGDNVTVTEADVTTEADATTEVDVTTEVGNVTVTEAPELYILMYGSARNDTYLLVITITGTMDGGWWVSNLTLDGDELVPNRKIAAAYDTSYHCSPAIELVRDQNVSLRLEGLQIQPKFVPFNGIAFESFGDAWDCVGFVNPIILCGFLVVFMLLIFLFIGIGCIMDIKINDRFDNPKGKTLIITVND